MSEVLSASSLQIDYMKLLTAQLQNQNPLEPLDNADMTAQLAQFSQLSQLEKMNTAFADVLKSVQRQYASSLIGKEVSFVGETGDGSVNLISGQVDQIANIDGKLLLGVGDYTLTLDDILRVKTSVESAADSDR
ncbi:MAG TPA: flagellar hook capping FlgD N-terminal domain-containing protein [Anaerohalosphaeraceae bacterium]|nr:flagellar hook capping protein [Phycisphaerae bacterium]HOK95030.1 flagellar hook capping FlgD N-terminal domain-containing protein [Anaerohalosphaeraceae bacterium]HOL30341.1 flagellar hook capping FlgD N-terminal domain-containing protein [Anaerohalosphaeraceae bacterium]HOM75401.1 flagellar hook capping FlgD N-terminal domain-containing protein [Anaerohalosphaeraceae bacterium]HPC63039.1 flagellar hook capping FlgD N-terminal domain-containing protein [Anaerohalosphaeraceae bacterium]